MNDQQNDPSVRQISGKGPDGMPILSVLARRTYTINQRGALEPVGEATPLVVDAVPDPANLDFLAADSDLWPYKPQTDVVVLGHAYGEEPTFQATICERQWRGEFNPAIAQQSGSPFATNLH